MSSTGKSLGLGLTKGVFSFMSALSNAITGPNQSSVPFSATGWETATSSANSGVTITTPAPTNSNLSTCIGGVYFSLSGSATVNSTLTITDTSGSGTVVFSLVLTEEGSGFIPFAPHKRTNLPGASFAVELSAGGSSVVGSLNLNCWQEL